MNRRLIGGGKKKRRKRGQVRLGYGGGVQEEGKRKYYRAEILECPPQVLAGSPFATCNRN